VNASAQETVYGGRYLRVDLSSGHIWLEQLDPQTHRQYLGGTCYGAKVLYDEVPPKVAWSDPDNRLIVASGPLGGTRVGGSGTVSVVTKGSLTNGAASCQGNGFLGAYLRSNSYDGVVIQGAAKDLTYLYLHDGQAELRDAGHLAGVNTWDMIDRVAEELGVKDSQLGMFGIGPAGENLVRFAAVIGDRGHAAGHNGTGAVMGAKRLKAIVAQRAQSPVPIHDRQALTEVANTLLRRIAENPASQNGVYRWGTLRGVARNARGGTGVLPVKNYTTSIYNISPEELEKWDGPYLQEQYTHKRHNCWACRFHHCSLFAIKDGPYAGFVGEEPEYEQFAAFGPQIGNTNVEAAIVMANECDRLGLENNELGWVLGLVMECYEKGILSREQLDGLDMRWGNVEAVRLLMRKIAHREGVGNVLAEGVKRAAEAIGGEALNFGVYTMKGNSPRDHDHRYRWMELFDTATSNTGTMETGQVVEMPLDALRAIGLDGVPNGFSSSEVSTFNGVTKGAMMFEDSLGVCRFNTRIDMLYLPQAVNAVTGYDMDPMEALRVGQRAVNLLRAFNLRHGIGPELDAPSRRYGSTPLDGPAAGVGISLHWPSMLANYYQILGWNEQGIPKRETLEALGIGYVADDLQLDT
jgi:aldehyde:ferredoxin oxidoreductase